MLELRAMNVNRPETVLDAVEDVWEGASASVQPGDLRGELGGAYGIELWVQFERQRREVPVKE